MEHSEFVYVTYIRTSAGKLWRALMEPEFTRKFWHNTVQESDWKAGSAWRIVKPDGSTADSGEVLEVVPPRRLVLKWQNQMFPEMTAEGFSRLTYELEEAGDAVKLTLTHEMEKSGSKLIDAVRGGWPRILASLKSLLETGESLQSTREWPKGL
jgi:uncharacterized protein YndB with AHSA1/START domain